MFRWSLPLSMLTRVSHNNHREQQRLRTIVWVFVCLSVRIFWLLYAIARYSLLVLDTIMGVIHFRVVVVYVMRSGIDGFPFLWIVRKYAYMIARRVVRRGGGPKIENGTGANGCLFVGCVGRCHA